MLNNIYKGYSAVIIIVLMILFAAINSALSYYLKSRPLVEKLSLVPNAQVMRLASVDHKEMAAAGLVMKVLMYYGGLMEKTLNTLALPADYPSMSRLIHASVKLDPYNMDAYYFAQAILVWDVRKVDVANKLMKYGMNYRDWDWYLPFFTGFNYAYFLKDYQNAAEYYRRAGELSGEPLFINLAGRYMHEAGRTPLAIAYLSAMENSARNESIRKSISLRLLALKQVGLIESAVQVYARKVGRTPSTIQDLIDGGFLDAVPSDPYGGQFYLEQNGKVRSTSKFAFPADKNMR